MTLMNSRHCHHEYKWNEMLQFLTKALVSHEVSYTMIFLTTASIT